MGLCLCLGSGVSQRVCDKILWLRAKVCKLGSIWKSFLECCAQFVKVVDCGFIRGACAEAAVSEAGHSSRDAKLQEAAQFMHMILRNHTCGLQYLSMVKPVQSHICIYVYTNICICIYAHSISVRSRVCPMDSSDLTASKN